MKYLKDIVDEKLNISNIANEKESFSTKYNRKLAPHTEQTRMFKKFFNDLSEIPGLLVSICKMTDERIPSELKYKIRSDEIDEIFNSPKTWKSVLHMLFHPSGWDIRTDNIIADITNRRVIWFLGLGNLDTSDISDLKKIGFIDVDDETILSEKGKYAYDKFYDKDCYSVFKNVLERFKAGDLQVFISFSDLYSNINKIYKEFFE